MQSEIKVVILVTAIFLLSKVPWGFESPIPFREPQSGSPTEILCQRPDSRIWGHCRGEPRSIKRPRLAELAACPTHRSAE